MPKSRGRALWVIDELPAYELLIQDESEKEEFKTWIFTLSVEDQEKVRKAIILERFSQ